MPTTIHARLNRAETAILCGRWIHGYQTCGGKLLDWHGATAAALLREPLDDHGAFSVFAPGWHQGVDGVWCLTNHAARRLAKDSVLASGNPAVPVALVSPARDRVGTGMSARYRRTADRTPFKQGAYTPGANTAAGVDEPFLARCPQPGCGAINRVDPQALGQEASRRRRAHRRFDELVAGVAALGVKAAECDRGRCGHPECQGLTHEDLDDPTPTELAARINNRWRFHGAEEERLRALAETILSEVRAPLRAPP